MNDRMTAFVRDRVRRIDNGDGAVPLAADQDSVGKLVIHILPFSAFANPVQIDVAAARGMSNLLQPIANDGNPKFNFDGVLVAPNAEAPRGYTQVFRNGILEAGKMRVAARTEQQVLRIPMRAFIEPVYQRFPGYMRALQALAVTPPYAVSLTVTGVRGSYLGVHNNPWGFEGQSRIDRDTLFLPVQVIHDLGSDAHYRAALTPAVDALFNAGGFESAAAFLANYNEAGVWNA